MPLHSYTPICSYAPRGVDTAHMAQTPVHLYVIRGFCMLWGVVRDPFHVGYLPYTSPCIGVPPHYFTPHSLVGFSVHLYVSWISVCDMRNISLM